MITDHKELHGKDGCGFSCGVTDEGTVCTGGTEWRERFGYWLDESDIGKKVIFTADGTEHQGTILDVGVTMGDAPVILTTISVDGTGLDYEQCNLETNEFQLAS